MNEGWTAADPGRDVDTVRDVVSLTKRSLTVAGHRTSISLEQAFWSALRDIATARGLAVAALVAEVDRMRGSSNLSSALRVFVLTYFRDPVDPPA